MSYSLAYKAIQFCKGILLRENYLMKEICIVENENCITLIENFTELVSMKWCCSVMKKTS